MCSLMTGASRQLMGEQERDNGLEVEVRTRRTPVPPSGSGYMSEPGHHSVGLQGIPCSQGKARFPSELESAGTVQRRVWIEGILVTTEQYGDKDLSDKIDLGSLDILRSLE